MADLGLLAGIAQGLNQGLGSYIDTKRSLEADALRKRMQGYDEALKKAQIVDLLGSEGAQQALSGIDPGANASAQQQTSSGLVGKEPSSPGLMGPLLGKKQREENQKMFGYDVQLAPFGQRAVKDPVTGAMKIEDIPEDHVSPRAKRKITKEELDIEKEKVNLAKAKKELEKEPKTNVEKLGGDAKQKIGFIATGLDALSSYEKLYNSGQRQKYVNSSTPLVGGIIGDTPIDQERTRMEEAIGRLASGGAINKAEEERFRKFLPRAADTEEEARRKMSRLRQEFLLKAQAFGLSEADIPKSAAPTSSDEEINNLVAPQKTAKSGGLIKPKDIAPGKVQKVKVSNGKEILMIDSSDLSSAQQDGYSVVR